jgi:hypothetical protein
VPLRPRLSAGLPFSGKTTPLLRYHGLTGLSVGQYPYARRNGEARETR